MFLTDLSIKRPVVASVMCLLLVILGLFTFNQIPTDELPDVQPPVVTIQTEYKGASAEIIDTQITQRIEDFVGGTPGLETIDSFSEDESSRITLTFENNLDLRLSIINLLDKIYISDAQNNDPYNSNYADFDAKSAGVFFGLETLNL